MRNEKNKDTDKKKSDLVYLIFANIFGYFIDVIFEYILFYTGKIFLKMITLNKYPQDNISKKAKSGISLLGLVLIILIYIIIAQLLCSKT